MDLIYYFFIALILSLLGSLPIGIITLTIIQKTIEKGNQSGLMISLGATIMEFVYTYIALISLDLFTKNLAIGNYIKIFAIVIFFLLGTYYFFKKTSPKLKQTSEYDYFDFLRGFVVGLMNMLIIPFWIFLGIWLKSNGMAFDDHTCILIFSLGAAIGAFLAFLAYIWFSGFISKKVKTINQYTNKVVGVLFLGLGVFQLIQMF